MPVFDRHWIDDLGGWAVLSTVDPSLDLLFRSVFSWGFGFDPGVFEIVGMGEGLQPESLILAQNERWRQA